MSKIGLLIIATNKYSRFLDNLITSADESHMNRYFIDTPPTKILDPSYCHIEGTKSNYTPKLVALNKNHREIREL